jgi:hypothetical protein
LTVERRESVELSLGDLRVIVPLLRRKLRSMEARYDKPHQVEIRRRLAAEGKRDAAGWAIDRCRDLIDRLEAVYEDAEESHDG